MSASDVMSENIRKHHHHVFPTMDEEYKLTTRKSSKPQQNLKKMAEKIKLPRGSEGVKCPGKLRVEGDFYYANADECSFQRLDVYADARAIRPKSSRDLKNQMVKGEPMKNDELVRHMTRLPEYLQKAEWGETLQEKALNVGVLDWRRLEKFTQKSKALNVARILNADNLSRNELDCDENISNTKKLLSESYPGIARIKAKHHRAVSELGKSLSDFRDCSDRRDEKLSGIKRHVKSRVEGMTGSTCVVHDGQIYSLNSEVSALSKIRRKQESACSKEKGIIDDDGISKRDKNQPASETKALELNCSAKHSNIVRFPRGSPSSSSLEASQQGYCMKKFHQNSKEAPKVCSSGSYAGQLSSGNTATESRTTDRVSKCLEDASHVLKSGSQLPDDDYSEKNVADPKSSSKAGKFEYVDQESTELATQRGPSSRRFNLSGISRSFSHKESKTSVCDTSTIISGRSGLLTATDSFLTREKQNVSSKSRFSSLRRLFDPILKYKPATSNSCAEDAQINLDSSIHNSITSNESHYLKNPGLTFQAVLQLAVINEGPALKFMVENNHQILTCSMKDLTSSGNHESSKKAFTFYSLDGNKRKSGRWIGQGCKTKSADIVCREVGHMCMTRLENPAGHLVEKEYVLSSSEVGNSGKENRHHDSDSRAEFAAIVSKVPIHACEYQNKYIGLVEGKTCFCDISSDDYGSTTVIIPGAFHSLPDNGEPSSLINRWRSGGSCDCGGWDVGCKLNILSNQKSSCKLTAFDGCSTSKCFELILQGESSDSNGTVFSLRPEKKGIYSVKFDSFISSLQAFSICVAFVSSQISCAPIGTSHFPEHGDSGPLSSDQISAAKHPQVLKVKDPGKISQPKHLPLTPLDRV